VQRAAGIAVGVALLAGALLALAPATLLDTMLAARTDHRVRLADAEGFWWRGRGMIARADGGAHLPIAWRVAWVPLLHRALVIDLQPGTGDDTPSGEITVQHGALEVRNLHVRAPAAVALAFAPASQALAWGGDIVLDAPAFAWHDRSGAGRFDALWRQARVVAGTLALDLGNVTVSPASAGADAAARASAAAVHNSGGDVAVDGTLTSRDGGVDVALTLKPTPASPQAIRQVLPLLGAPDGAGGVQIRWRSDR
jgi:hypothetical protein